eukprot:TRINITY_DN20021_c0_g1_i1.p1 TRINITY_DN20021_c0_g1~~TRINITY_DN20021_c0_g1_i1.p1  ORF type:complete len:325 (-),score=89.30 TRINITY_DN20021_c0_g1_i1:36-1010(-)
MHACVCARMCAWVQQGLRCKETFHPMSQINVVQTSLRSVDRKERQLTRHVQEVTQKVHARFDQLVTWGQKSRDGLLDAVSGKEDEDKGRLQAEKSTMTAAVTTLSSLVSRAATQAARNAPDVLVLRTELKAALLSDQTLDGHRQQSQDTAWSWSYDPCDAGSVLQAHDVQVYMGSLVEGAAAADGHTPRLSLQDLTARVDRVFQFMSEAADKITTLTETDAELEKKITSNTVDLENKITLNTVDLKKEMTLNTDDLKKEMMSLGDDLKKGKTTLDQKTAVLEQDVTHLKKTEQRTAVLEQDVLKKTEQSLKKTEQRTAVLESPT